MNIACTSASWKNRAFGMSSSASLSGHIFLKFFSKVEEGVTAYTHNFMKNIEDFKFSLESLKKSSKVLNAKASEVEEQIKSPLGSCRNKRKREVEEWLRRVKSIEHKVVVLGNQVGSEGFIRNLLDGGKVAQLHEDVVMLLEQSHHFDELQLDTRGTRGVELLTTKMVGKAFDENFKKIWDFLEKREVSSIGIYGMGGVGKTALAKFINNQLLKRSEVRVFWIPASQEFTIKSLQDKLASFLGVNFLNECDEDLRAARLHGAFSEIKNSVLILDDLWENIELLKVGCPISAEFCRLIITTRSLEVCHQMSCQEIIAVKTLDYDEAWKLFIETHTLGKKMRLGPHVEEVATSMVRLCGGLPLGIFVMAGKMRGVTSIHSWKTALAEMMESQTMQDAVFRALKYSFDRLNSQSQCKEFNVLQLCFLYCSLYLQIHFFGHKNGLVDRFISEGLLDGKKSRRAQAHQGYSIVDKLVHLCLLESDGDDRVKMHNLVKGMALKISEGKCMVRIQESTRTDIPSSKEIPVPNEEEWTNDLEKVFLAYGDMMVIRDGMSPNCPRLSTLFLRNNHLKAIPDTFFSKMKRLTILDLCRTHITTLPDSLVNLENLESLLLEGCDMLETVPYLGKLKVLRELNLSYTAIKEVPQGLQELHDLEFLSMNADKLEMLPRGLLLKLSHLQVAIFPVQVQMPIEEILNLDEVEQLHGRLSNVHAFNCFIESRKNDIVYKVEVGPVHHDKSEYFGPYDRGVCLKGCNLEDEAVLGRYIEFLKIKKCVGMSKCLLDDFSVSSSPASLKSLTVKRCEGIECMLTSWQGSSSYRFSTLVEMVLKELKDFKGLLIQEWEMGAPHRRSIFSSLKRLTIENCNEVRKLRLPVNGAPNLDFIRISECGKIEEIFEDDNVGWGLRLKLTVLWLVDLPSLKALCSAQIVCDSIHNIFITRCPALAKKFPLHFAVLPPPTLRIIAVEREWWESLEWENPNLPHLLKHLVRLR